MKGGDSVNKRKLLGVIVENGDTQRELSKAIGISLAALSAKINGKREFKLSEISTIAVRYGLDKGAIYDIFFAEFVALNSTGGITSVTAQSV